MPFLLGHLRSEFLDIDRTDVLDGSLLIPFRYSTLGAAGEKTGIGVGQVLFSLPSREPRSIFTQQSGQSTSCMA